MVARFRPIYTLYLTVCPIRPKYDFAWMAVAFCNYDWRLFHYTCELFGAAAVLYAIFGYIDAIREPNGRDVGIKEMVDSLIDVLGLFWITPYRFAKHGAFIHFAIYVDTELIALGDLHRISPKCWVCEFLSPYRNWALANIRYNHPLRNRHIISRLSLNWAPLDTPTLLVLTHMRFSLCFLRSLFPPPSLSWCTKAVLNPPSVLR